MEAGLNGPDWASDFGETWASETKSRRILSTIKYAVQIRKRMQLVLHVYMYTQFEI